MSPPTAACKSSNSQPIFTTCGYIPGLIRRTCLVMFVVLIVYAVPWLKMRKQEFFKPVQVEKVMAMENDKYQEYHRQKKIVQRTNNEIEK